MSKYWPDVSSVEGAKSAAQAGAGWCFFVAGVTAVVASISVFTKAPVLGIDAWAYLDAAVFGFAGWRIWKLSRTWSVIALLLFVAERALVLMDGSFRPGAILLGIIISIALIGSVRGTFAYHRLAKPVPQTAFVSTSSGAD